MAAKVITKKTLNAPFLFSFFFAVYGGSWREWCTVFLRLPKWEAQHHLRILDNLLKQSRVQGRRENHRATFGNALS